MRRRDKVNENFGVRFGKVKTPAGLFNDIQDIDPVLYVVASAAERVSDWQPQYPPAQDGGVVYGTIKLGAKAGKLEYRGWGGENALARG
jgi:hypothetical protein